MAKKEDKEKLSAAEKIRKISNWLDWMNEDFNSNFKDVKSIAKVWEKRQCDMVDNLNDYAGEGKHIVHDGKLVNEAFGFEYYDLKYLETGEETEEN